MKRLLIKVFFIVIILYGLNFFFSHIAFNKVLSQHVAGILVNAEKLTFNSYFSWFPRPAIHINSLSYKQNGHVISAKRIQANLNLSSLLWQRRLNIDVLNIDELYLKLPSKKFDFYFKQWVFKMIREKLGINFDKQSAFPIRNFKISNFQLTRQGTDEKTRNFFIEQLYSMGSPNTILTACFQSPKKAQKFNQTMLSPYLLKPIENGACLSFVKRQGGL